MTSGHARAVAAGSLGVAAALAVGELAAGLVAAVPSPLDAVGQLVVSGLSGPVLSWAIETFGSANRLVLTGGTVVIALGIGAVLGLLARGGLAVPGMVFAGFGIVGSLASLSQPGATAAFVVLTMIASVTVGILVLTRLLAVAEPDGGRPTDDGMPRRGFLMLAAATASVSVVAVALGRYALGGRAVLVDLDDLVLPSPAVARPPVSASQDLSTVVDGVSPVLTPTDGFFRIDTAIAVPRVDPETWQLRVHGLVDRELVLTYDQLRDLPMREVDATISCVSNEVGGDLIGTARWLGTPLAGVLERAGIGAGAEQVVGRSVDGWTSGFPIEAVTDGRDSLVAIGMNGDPLPARHGFPARLIVPGLYGYVSATKWLSEIELTTWEGFDAYWVPRGWAKRGPVKTSSRIDVPRRGATVEAGEVVVAGVAWAPTRGIERVEVQVDDGSFVAAELTPPLSEEAWVQWRAVVALEPGSRRLRVRATDGTGQTQSDRPRPPAPDGAEGWHAIRVEVR